MAPHLAEQIIQPLDEEVWGSRGKEKNHVIILEQMGIQMQQERTKEQAGFKRQIIHVFVRDAKT